MIHTLIITLLLSIQLYSNENININPLTNFVSANNQFTFKLLKETNKKNENSFFSPISISSIFGASGGFGKSSSYHASKGAVSAMTRNASIRYANDNIRINSVSPGFIKVLREEKTIEEAGDTMSQDILSRTPMGRWGDADEVAAAIYFLASSESSYITGAELFVDGGWMAT